MTVEPTLRGQAPALQLLKTVSYVIGSILLFVALAMAASALLSAIYSEYETSAGIAISAVITAIAGMARRRT
jgi:predicted tellurium resistance membrane protein TerC